MAKCPICGGTGDTTNNIPPTNEQWFCSLPTEEKAKWLNDKIIICAVCDQQKICGYFINETCHLCPYHEGKNKSWEAWLKQPHTTTKG